MHLGEEPIQAKIGELAAQIATDYAGKEVLLVGVLKGAVLFMSDFARALQLPTQMEFMAVSSYGTSASTSPTSSSSATASTTPSATATCPTSRPSSPRSMPDVVLRTTPLVRA